MSARIAGIMIFYLDKTTNTIYNNQCDNLR